MALAPRSHAHSGRLRTGAHTLHHNENQPVGRSPSAHLLCWPSNTRYKQSSAPSSNRGWNRFSSPCQRPRCLANIHEHLTMPYVLCLLEVFQKFPRRSVIQNKDYHKESFVWKSRDRIDSVHSKEWRRTRDRSGSRGFHEPCPYGRTDSAIFRTESIVQARNYLPSPSCCLPPSRQVVSMKLY